MTGIRLEGLRVLVVDDSRTARRFVIETLRQLGVAEAVEAEDGADAIDILRVFAADLVVTDLNMDPLDGIQFTQLLRMASDSPAPHVPVIMLTADATRRQLENALKAGVNSFLAKPVTADKLRSHMLRTLAATSERQPARDAADEGEAGDEARPAP